jgi:hypothetical protein
MTEETKWCTLCQRYVVPKKEFNSIGWVGLVAGLSVLVASIFNEPLALSIMNNTLAAALATGVGNIMFNVLLLLVAPLVLISVGYCLYYSEKQPHCPICNSQSLTDSTSRISTDDESETDYESEGDLGQAIDEISSAETPTPIKTPSTQSSAQELPSVELQWSLKDPLILLLSLIAVIAVIVGLIFYALASGLISF